jgi:hypothetical protein
MSHFRTKLLGLAAFATMFAGASYGQLTSCANGTVVPGPLSVRGEGTTELVGDQAFSCVYTTGTATATVTVFESAPVTSQLLNPQLVAGANQTEAALFICSSAANCATNPPTASAGPYYGTASGNSLSFSGVTLPAATFFGRITNVRINASAVTIGATLTTATGTTLVSANSTSAATLAATLGFIFKSLNPPAFITNPNGGTSPTLTTYTACAGNALSATTPRAVSFGVTVAESFAGAFKVGTGLQATTNGEGGSFVGAPPSGTAISGTKIQLVFGNVADGETIYVPTSITNTVGAIPLTLTLVTSATSSVAIPASTTTGAPAAVAPAPFSATETYEASAALTTSNGTATAYYEVTASTATAVQNATIPVFVTFASNLFTTVTPAITVLESYASTGGVPSFAAPTNTALNATVVSLCQTSLLFPFVTNQLGFDTGIVLSNTSADPFGTSQTPGTCALSFYGSGAPTPGTGVAAPGGTQASGTTNAFLLSTVAPGFQGYMIAQCTYNFGHGFGFLAYDLTQNSGVTQGYLALVINDRVGSGASEGLPQ